MTKQQYVAVIVVVVILVGLFALISNNSPGTTPTTLNAPGGSLPPMRKLDPELINKHWSDLLSAAAGPAIGNAHAPNTIVEIGDFQCPQCGRCRPLLEQMLAQSRGRLKLYFVNFPLPMHPHAHFAAQAALAGSAQGKFWQMYDLLYSHQDELIPTEVQYYVEQSIPGIDIDKFEKDLASKPINDRIQQEVKLVQSLHFEATPTFVLRKSAGGTPSCYIGMNDTSDSLGLQNLALHHPW